MCERTRTPKKGEKCPAVFSSIAHFIRNAVLHESDQYLFIWLSAADHLEHIRPLHQLAKWIEQLLPFGDAPIIALSLPWQAIYVQKKL